jgi:diadenosine tetraphosphate (Ap4A) HIT family hydrolase
MPEEEYLELMRVVYKIANHYEKTLDCGINIWNNNKEVANQIVHHVHVHVVPRLQSKKTYALENGDKYNEGEAQGFVEKLKFEG